MYHFPYFLPFLPIEYRRRLSYSLLVSFSLVQARDPDFDEDKARQIIDLYNQVQDYEMHKLEMYGKTNTRINPFDL